MTFYGSGGLYPFFKCCSKIQTSSFNSGYNSDQLQGTLCSESFLDIKDLLVDYDVNVETMSESVVSADQSQLLAALVTRSQVDSLQEWRQGISSLQLLVAASCLSLQFSATTLREWGGKWTWWWWHRGDHRVGWTEARLENIQQKPRSLR